MAVTQYETTKGTRWRVRFRTNGKDIRRNGFRTKRDAQAWEAENVLSVQDGTFVDSAGRKLKLSILLDDYMSRPGALAPSSLAGRASVARTWVAPYWDDRRLGQVTPADVEEWLDVMRSDGAKEDTVEKAYRVLAGMMTLAVNKRLLRVSPMPKLKLKKRVKPRPSFLTAEQVIELSETVDPRDRLLILLLAFTGIRFGEAAALRMRHVRLDARRIDVEGSVTEVQGRLTTGPTKSGRSRAVPIPGFLADELAQLAGNRTEADLLFTSPGGGYLRLSTWRQRSFMPAIDRLVERYDAKGLAPFPRVTPHDLRHAAASLAVHSGANIKVLQRMLGHSSAALTLDTYADLYDADLDDVMAKVDATMLRARNAAVLTGAG